MDAQAQAVAQSVSTLVATLQALGWGGGVLVGGALVFLAIRWIRAEYGSPADRKRPVSQPAACAVHHADLGTALKAVTDANREIVIVLRSICADLDQIRGAQERHGERLIKIEAEVSR